MKKLFISLLTAFSVFAFTSCGNSSSTINGQIVLSNEEISIEKYDTFTIEASLEEIDGTLAWASSDTKVATVDKNGVIKGVGTGECLITASVGKNKSSCKVHVTPCSESALLVCEVEQSNIFVSDEVSYDVYATYKGEKVDDVNFSVGFFDNNPLDVALVSYANDKITITGLKAGETTATVYANVKDTDLITTISITVSNI